MKTINKNTILSAAGALLFICCSPSADTVAGRRTDALDCSFWDVSCWISAADAPVVDGKIKTGTRAADGSSWFVSTVSNDAKVASAKWMTSGLGVYELYVNGKVIGTEILKPGFTHYAKTKISYTYDITDAYKTGKGAANVLAAQVTPGWWGDKIITPADHVGMIGRKCAFRGVLELTFADGSTRLYGTDTTGWKAGIAGPVKHAAIFDGEEFDAREPLGFCTPDKLGTPEENTEFKGEIFPTDGAEIYFRRDLALAPVRAYVWKDIEGAGDGAYGKVVIKREYAPGEPITLQAGETLVVDFGQNCAAVPSFVFKAKEGTKITCLTSEILNDGNGAVSRGMDGPEGSIHRLNLRTPDDGMRLEYTFAKASGYSSFIPRCTFFGYRLVSITSTDEVVIKNMASVPVSSIAENMEIGRIATGDELVNRLISNTYWGELSNYLSVPTDCPQRNERLGWTADTQVFAGTGSFFANTQNFFRKWMRDMRDTQSPLGSFPGVAPRAQYGNDMMRVGWADAGVIVPWTIWKQFGDSQIVDENWDAMEKFMDHVAATKYDHDVCKAENGNYQWADWLSYEPLESHGGSAFTMDAKGKRVPLPESVEYWKYLSANYWLIDAGMMHDMAVASGRDASKYEAMQKEAKEYLLFNFLTKDGRFKTEILNTMQTPALFALRNELVSGTARDRMLAGLRKNFEDHGNCLQTGFLGTSIIMQALTRNGMADIAYELLFQRKNPSWLYSVDNGATTMWERWNSYMLDKGMGPKGMNSFNHYAYGCVCQWIWETAAGICADVDAPGFRHIIMSPIPDRRLGYLDAEYKSAAGIVRSSWKYEGDKWIWTFTIPDGATATVTLPGEAEGREYGAGTYTVEK